MGAAAIVTSLVLFAMQVNIERMPHGLFRRLSADLRLLGAFLLAFILAIVVATLSVFVDQSRLALVVLVAFWAVVFILILFLYAYRRALDLINPSRQLKLLILDTQKELRTWARRAKRVTPLFKREEGASATSSPPESTHDLARKAFFQFYSQWTNGAKLAIRHAMSFARRYAERGDYEISGEALKAVVCINAAYIKSKGKTFYAKDPFSDNPLSNDSFINDTLEHLRQIAQSGITRRDEQQIEQTLRTMEALVQEYLRIDYSSPYATKSHAQIAAHYLAGALQDVVPHGMADVLLVGQRLVGQSAQGFLVHGEPNHIKVFSEKIALIAYFCCAKEDHRPVTEEGISQLANLTFELLRSGIRDIHFVVEKVHQDVASVAQVLLNVPDTGLPSIHSTYLGPYYSSTSPQSLSAKLNGMVNELYERQADDRVAQSVIRNIEQWAGSLCQTEEELLLAAIKVKSQFTFDMIYWITDVTKILLYVLGAPACAQHSQEKLREHALWLIATLTRIPDDRDTVTFVETFQMTEKLFEAASNAHDCGCDDIAKQISGYLLSWTFKCGKHRTGCGVLERGLCASAVIALRGEEGDVDVLTSNVRSWVQGDGAPQQDVLEHAASGIRERTTRLSAHEYGPSEIEKSMSRMDHKLLSPLFFEIAGILSSERA